MHTGIVAADVFAGGTATEGTLPRVFDIIIARRLSKRKKTPLFLEAELRTGIPHFRTCGTKAQEQGRINTFITFNSKGMQVKFLRTGRERERGDEAFINLRYSFSQPQSLLLTGRAQERVNFFKIILLYMSKKLKTSFSV